MLGQIDTFRKEKPSEDPYEQPENTAQVTNIFLNLDCNLKIIDMLLHCANFSWNCY